MKISILIKVLISFQCGNTFLHTKKTSYVFIAIDDEALIINGEHHPINMINKLISENTQYITLTIKEREKILTNSGKYLNNIHVFEVFFNFIENIKYSTAKNNYKTLLSLSKEIKNNGLHLAPFPSQNYHINYNKMVGCVRKKSSLDHYFYYLPIDGFQEVFKYQESRKNRKIICLDFNSMYLSCMLESFPNPEFLCLIDINEFFSGDLSLTDGVYEVELKNPTGDFVKNYHYLKYTHQFKSTPFKITKNKTIKVTLTLSEIEYFSEKFEKIYIKRGITSKNNIKHPLLDKGLKLFNRKDKQINIKKKITKSEISLLHSTGRRTNWKTKKFHSEEDACNFIESIFNVKIKKKSKLFKFLI